MLWNVSGFKVFTRVVDEVLVRHPDVDSAATVGLPDPNRPGSEIVASAIVLKAGREKNEAMKQEIIAYMKGEVASYKVPRVIEFMDQLPLSPREKRACFRKGQMLRESTSIQAFTTFYGSVKYESGIKRSGSQP